MRRKSTVSHRPFLSSSINYIGLIDAYTKRRALIPGRVLHAHLIVNGLVSSAQVAAKFIAFYTTCKQFSVARKVFDKIPSSNISAWVSFIGSCARNGYYQEAVVGFAEMQRAGFKYDRIMFPSVLKACGHLSDWRTGERLHAVVLKNEFEGDEFVMCALIFMYSKCGMLDKAKRAFSSMVGKDLVALNAMVSGYVQNGFVKEALALVEEMKLSGVEPDIVTFNSLISGFSQANDFMMVSDVFKNMNTYGVKPDVVSWTSVISGLTRNFHSAKAISMFRQMLRTGLLPTATTISALLPASACTSHLRYGKEIHGYSVVMGFEKDVYVRSSLIDMYAKCGLISDAMLLFEKMSMKTTVTWNSMIFGYANHGYCCEAIELLHQMMREAGREEPDHLTFTAALTACVHGEMVDLGKRLFDLMQGNYGIQPRLEHYACTVDLLGRAGKLKEAHQLIQEMPMEPDLFVWGALLGACRRHNRVDLAEIAAKHLAKLEPKCSGSSTVLMNLYTELSSLENARKMKKMIKKRNLRSFAGCSWIGI